MQVWRTVGVWLLGLMLFGCASTPDMSPGKPLPGIGLGASGEHIMLSWSKDGGLAKRLRPGSQLNVTASYETQYGPVLNEVVASNTVPQGFPGVKLKLKERLGFEPEGRVCLRLTVNRQTIPVRIAKPAQSVDGFYYSEWSQNAGVLSEKAILNSKLNIASVNIENYSRPDRALIQWQKENNIASINDCENLAAETVFTKPETALQGAEKNDAVGQQCVFLYERAVQRSGRFSDAQVSAFTNFDGIINAVQDSPTHLAVAKQMRADFATYRPGKEYFKGSQLPINVAPLMSAASLGQDNEVSRVSAQLLTEGYEGCRLEANNRFDSSYADWQEMTRPQTVSARREPMRKLCRARFAREDERQRTLQELLAEKSQIQAELTSLQRQPLVALPPKKPLIPYACNAG